MSAPVQATPFQSTSPQGHRGRMRDRLLTRGPEGLADYEVLEMLLFLGIPRGDTKPLAKGLINAFGSLGRVLAATPDALTMQGAMPPEGILPLRLVQAAADRLARADAIERPMLGSLQLVETYLRERATPPGSTRILFLDNRNRLLGEEPAADGEALPIRPVLRRALSLHATALLVADISEEAPARPAAAAAHRLAQAASLVSVTLHDRLVLRQDGLKSYRAAGLFKPLPAAR